MKKFSTFGSYVQISLSVFLSGCIFCLYSGPALSAATRGVTAELARSTVHKTFSVAGQQARLIVGDRGGLALHVGSMIVTTLARTSGLWIRDVTNGSVYRVAGNIREDGNVVIQSWTSKVAGLHVEVRYESMGDHFLVTGRIIDTTGHARGIDVVLSLSPRRGGKEAQWLIWRDFQTAIPLSEIPFRQITYPLVVASQPEGGRAFALTIPPIAPAVFESEASSKGSVRLWEKLGITHAGTASLYGRAPFSFGIYPVDAQWGMRDALAKYYAAYPAVFQRRTRASGLWLRTNVRAVPDPADYGFREGGPVDAASIEKGNVMKFPYVIVGQREFVGLRAFPKTYAEMILAFENAKINAKKVMGWGTNIKDVIRNSGIFDANGEYRVIARQPRFVVLRKTTGTAPIRLTFPLNPNPRLFSNDAERVTVAKAVLGWVGKMLRVDFKIGGIYVDSLGFWGRYLNYRRSHFPYATIPLTYGPGGRPAIANKFSQLEFLWALGHDLHKRGKLVWGNGIGPGRIFDGFALDVLSNEIGRTNLFRAFRFARAVADQKPYLEMDDHQRDWLDPNFVAQYWKLSTLYDVFPGFAPLYQKNTALYEQYKPIIDEYLPILRRLAAAGWQPITDVALRVDHSRQPPWAQNPQILVERYGSSGSATLYLTLYNCSSKNRFVVIHPVASVFGNLASSRVTELLWHKDLAPKNGAIMLTIPAHALRVIAVRGVGKL